MKAKIQYYKHKKLPNTVFKKDNNVLYLLNNKHEWLQITDETQPPDLFEDCLIKINKKEIFLKML